MASAWTPSLVLTGGFWSGLFSVEVSPGMKGMSCPFVDGEYKAGMPRSPESPSADPCSSISFWRYAGPGKAEFGYTAPAQRRREELHCLPPPPPPLPLLLEVGRRLRGSLFSLQSLCSSRRRCHRVPRLCQAGADRPCTGAPGLWGLSCSADHRETEDDTG